MTVAASELIADARQMMSELAAIRAEMTNPLLTREDLEILRDRHEALARSILDKNSILVAWRGYFLQATDGIEFFDMRMKLLEHARETAQQLAARGCPSSLTDQMIEALQEARVLRDLLALDLRGERNVNTCFEEAPAVIRISPLAYLRSCWSILWACFRHPRSRVDIDLSTGRIIRIY